MNIRIIIILSVLRVLSILPIASVDTFETYHHACRGYAAGSRYKRNCEEKTLKNEKQKIEVKHIKFRLSHTKIHLNQQTWNNFFRTRSGEKRRIKIIWRKN